MSRSLRVGGSYADSRKRASAGATPSRATIGPTLIAEIIAGRLHDDEADGTTAPVADHETEPSSAHLQTTTVTSSDCGWP